MGNLKDKLRKPAITWGLIAALGLGAVVLSLRNIGLKNQNDYLFDKYSKTGNLYTNLVSKYGRLRRDSMDASINHSLNNISLKGENLKLAYKLDSLQEDYIRFVENSTGLSLELNSDMDSLQKEYIGFVEESLDKAKGRRDFFEEVINLAEEKEFYKAYAARLDSLLSKCESNKMFPDMK